MSVKMKLDGLNQLRKAIEEQMNRPVKIRVGIMGEHTARTRNGPTNAEIGAAHEFGAPARGLPERSFLRVPLHDNLGKQMDQAGVFTKAQEQEVVREGSLKPWASKIAVLAESIVKGAFATNGYGKWKSWKRGYQSSTGQILVDTTQLRDSITSEVVE